MPMLAAHALQPVGARAGRWPPPCDGRAARRRPRGPPAATPVQASPSTSTCVQVVREAQVHARRRPGGAPMRAYSSRARSVPRWRMRAVHELEARLDGAAGVCRPAAPGRDRRPPRAPSAPNARYTPSTSPMAACTASWPMRSGKSPPTSLGQRQLAVGERARAREPRGDAARLAAHARARGPAQLLGAACAPRTEPAPCPP